MTEDAVSLANEDALTMLRTAIREKNIKLIHFLIETNPDLLHQNNETAMICLEYAIDADQVLLVQKIVSIRPFLINLRLGRARVCELQTTLERSIVCNHLTIVRIMLARLPSAASTIDEEGKTLLHVALSPTEPNEAMVEYILSCVPPDFVGIPSKDGYTALHLAVEKNMLKIVKVLHAMDSRAAKLRTKTHPAKNPFYIALDHGLENIVDFFLTADLSLIDTLGYQKQNVLFTNANAKTMKKLLDLRPSLIDCQNVWQETPLHNAVHWNRAVVAALFIAAKPSLIYARNPRDETALEIAFKAKSYSTVDALLRHVPDVYCINSDGNTPLHMAVVACHFETLRRVFEHNKCLLNTKNNNKETPFHIAAQNKNAAAVGLFRPHATVDMVVEAKHCDVYSDLCLFIHSQFVNLKQELLRDLVRIVFDYLDL